MQAVLFIEADGTIHAVQNDAVPLETIGNATKRRASNVWPCHPVKRIAFRALRALFGERGRVAEWCRRWRGPWEVRFIDPLSPRRAGAVVFSHPSRRVCIDWEIKQINHRLAYDRRNN